MSHFGQCPLGVAVEQNVGTRIDKHRATYLVTPVIVLSNAAQAGLNAANNNRHIFIGLAAALTVNDDGAIRTFAAFAMGRVGVIVAHAQVGGIAVDERIHIAASDAVEEIGLAQLHEVIGALPVGLGDDAHP